MGRMHSKVRPLGPHTVAEHMSLIIVHCDSCCQSRCIFVFAWLCLRRFTLHLWAPGSTAQSCIASGGRCSRL